MERQTHVDRRYADVRVSNDVMARVRKVLRLGPRTADELVEATGISRSQVSAALHHVGVVLLERRPRGGGRGRPRQVWTLPDVTQPQPRLAR